MSRHQIELLRDLNAQIPQWVKTGEFAMNFLAPKMEFDFTHASFEQGVVRGLDAFREEAGGLSEQAMSQENVEIVRDIYADERGLTDGATGKVAPDGEFDFSATQDA